METKNTREDQKEITTALAVLQDALDDYEERGGDVFHANIALDMIRRYLKDVLISDGSEQQEYEGEMSSALS